MVYGSGRRICVSVIFTCIFSILRAAPTTFMPCFTRSSHMAAPMPELAPVTIATQNIEFCTIATPRLWRVLRVRFFEESKYFYSDTHTHYAEIRRA
ncbi:hypothetical protein Avbf_08953 [Armadillidium vulgare]|nr:hypothetical protein Avbf_08953 [Armadillidium vulgare]